MIVSTPRETLWAWINHRLGIHWSADFRAIGLVEKDVLKAAVGYNGFVGKTCCMHVAVDDPRCLNRPFIRAAFDYAFNQAGVHTVLGLVDSKNDKAIKFNHQLGFEPKHTIEGAGLEGDLIIYQMTRKDCKWLKEKEHGKEVSASSS